MGFVSANQLNCARFNSQTSCDFLSFYESNLNSKIDKELHRKPSETIAPSSFRCDRKTWFRLRGSEPDKFQMVDAELEFKADLGTACHQMIQSNLIEFYKDDWIDIESYLIETKFPYKYVVSKNGFETQLSIPDLRINLSVDGILKIDGVYYLLEIKTCEYSTFRDLTNIKDEHIDQILCYSTVLNLHHVIVMYQDRSCGNLKCYELTVKDNDMDNIRSKISNVLRCVDTNIAPDRLSLGDKWCSYCPYTQKCKEWG